MAIGLGDVMAGGVLLVVNAGLAAGFGWPLARTLSQAVTGNARVRAWRAGLFGAYLLECVAFSASMATNVLGVVLAVVWGVLLGWSLGGRGRREVVHLSLRVALYTCLPAISFLSLLPLLAIAGWPILTADAGRRFGIPAFVPWPADTLLGFFVIVAMSAVVFKTVATTGIAVLTSQRRPVESTDPGRESSVPRKEDILEE